MFRFTIWIRSIGFHAAPLTCPPERCPLLVVGVEVLGEGVRLQQTVEQLEEVCRGHVSVHTLIWTELAAISLRLVESISLMMIIKF